MTGQTDPPGRSWSRLTAEDIYLFNEGTHGRLYRSLGAHPLAPGDGGGTVFAVWAPNAEYVSVVGDFNGWDRKRHPLELRESSGIWEGRLPEVKPGMIYKYHLRSRHQGYEVDKADPFALATEPPPRTASRVWELDYVWGDAAWMAGRAARQSLAAPMSTYELHVGSWRRVPEEANRPLSYRELAPRLAEHVQRLGFTHVELMPVMEHPFHGSWGYQVTGYFAPTSRYGTPQDFMYLIDVLHQHGIGVILDWVPSHFPSDMHGLAYFDGTHLYEHADPRQGFHPDWQSAIFNYGRNEVRSFLLSSALFWLDRYHADGLRVDAVASMLYLDYSRKAGEWVPNAHGGRENLEAIAFLRQMNEAVYREFPGVQTIAEESTAWPMVSRPLYIGGLGFGLKWDMGWMHDSLAYLSADPVFRRFQHNQITFRSLYAFHENFVLPLSHDEVVHGKGSLIGKMPGDDWQRFANLRLLYAGMYAQAGKKLLFMGAELAQWSEWNHDASLEWHLLEQPRHRGIARFLTDLNRLYRDEPALHELDCDPRGFEWIDGSDADRSVIAYLRLGRPPGEAAPGEPAQAPPTLLAVFNFTPVVRQGYRIGVPQPGRWVEVLNSDAEGYGGSNVGNGGGLATTPVAWHGRAQSLEVTLPPLAALFLRGPDTGS